MPQGRTPAGRAARRAAAEPGAAAIASRVAGGLYSLGLLAENIEDEPDNTTRFLVIADQDVDRGLEILTRALTG